MVKGQDFGTDLRSENSNAFNGHVTICQSVPLLQPHSAHPMSDIHGQNLFQERGEFLREVELIDRHFIVPEFPT